MGLTENSNNLVKSQPYRSIFLTSSGSNLAKVSKKRHEIVYNFLKIKCKKNYQL